MSDSSKRDEAHPPEPITIKEYVVCFLAAALVVLVLAMGLMFPPVAGHQGLPIPF